MISVGSIDEKKGLSLRYGFEGGKMEITTTDIEEGEACFQSNYDDASTIDPDISLSYIVSNYHYLPTTVLVLYCLFIIHFTFDYLLNTHILEWKFGFSN